MDRKEILLHLWDRSQHVEDWYPPLMQSLKDLSHSEALWKPAEGASHNIWQILNHLAFYKARFLARLQNRTFEVELKTNEQTFEWGIGTTQAEWTKRIEEFRQIHDDLRSRLAALSLTDLDKPCPEESVEVQLLSLIPHDSYHTGQILYIRKLQNSWPGERDS